MAQVTFALRTLTPLFLAGADQTFAELRAPTFRGLMRYWYRALVGGIVGANEDALREVVKAETAVFGATDRGSAVRVRVSEASKNPQRYRKEGYSRESTSGKDYFLWSMAESSRGKPGYKPDRFFFPENTTFEVTLSSHEDDGATLHRAVSAFWLLTHLGGVGSRSSRCAGSLEVRVDGETFAGFRFGTQQNVEALCKQLREGIVCARQFVPNHPAVPITRASFDALAPKTCRVWVLREKQHIWLTPDAAMRALGASLQSYRRQFDLREREIFGLPLGRNSQRYASPLLLRVTELRGGYVGVAVLFKTGDMQPYALIENWIESFSGKVPVTF